MISHIKVLMRTRSTRTFRIISSIISGNSSIILVETVPLFLVETVPLFFLIQIPYYGTVSQKKREFPLNIDYITLHLNHTRLDHYDIFYLFSLIFA